ncbi:MAG: MmcQ/YjbR family DNA-binding protein [Ferruginibacter sp.]
MVDNEAFKNMVLSFPDIVEMPHFEKTSFRLKNKIVATLDITSKKACIKLTETDQYIFATIDPTGIYPVNNKWGKQGWTFIELKKVKKNILKDALAKAYDSIAKPKANKK